MISIDCDIVEVPLTEESFGKRVGDPERNTLYEEGPWFYKRQGLYYLVYAASGIPENIAYATSTSPTGPWTYRGIIIPTQGGSFTNHPGIAEYKGNSYFFYHNGALPEGGGFDRSVCVEQFEYNEDGSFPTIQMTKEGVQPVGTLNPYQRNEAETISWEYGISTEKCNIGGMNVCDIDDGDYIRVNNVDFGSIGADSFMACVLSECVGRIELHVDSLDGNLVGSLTIPSSNGDSNWELLSTKISEVTGIHNLYFVFRGSDGNKLFKFDYWQFTQI